MQSKSVSLKNITKIFKQSGGKQVAAVENVSIEIQPGEFMTLLGPSGCGKTTILRMIAGFETPTSGEIFIGNENVNKLTPDKRDTAMVFQSYALFPHLNVFDNISYGLKLKKLGSSEIKNKVERILELVGLVGLEFRAPNQLSGGQQQRVALARALVMEPAVLLFDEPLSNLDAKLRVYMRSEIRRIQNELKITSIYVTHDQAEAMSMSDRIIVMNKGIIEQIGTPQETYTKPASKFVADFIGTANIIDGYIVDVNGDKADVNVLNANFSIHTDLNLTKKQAVKVVIRPEAVKVDSTEGIAAVVDSSVFMGSYQDYRLRIGEQVITVVDTDPVNKKVYSTGDNVFVQINPQSLHIVV